MNESLALVILLMLAAGGGAFRPNLAFPAIAIIGSGAVAGYPLAGVILYLLLLGVAILQYGYDDVVAV